MKKELTYVCLQTTQEGQAAYAHVHEIIHGLKVREWKIELLQPSLRIDASASSGERRVSAIISKILAFALCQIPVFVRPLPSAFYVRHHFAALITVAWARLTRTAVLVEVNGPYEDLFLAWPAALKLRRLLTWSLRQQLKWATKVIAVTPQLANWAATEGGHGRVAVIPNGANTSVFRPSDHKTLNSTYVLFFGALAPWQGIETMLQAVESPEWPQNTKLVIAGEGEMFELVRNKADIDDRVVAKGKIAYEMLPEVISGALASLSLQNNLGGRASTGLFPLKLFESLACATPVIVTDFPGMADFVREHKCGLVVPPDSPNEVAHAINELHLDASKARLMGENGLLEVRNNHSWDARAAQTEIQLLNSIRTARDNEL